MNTNDYVFFRTLKKYKIVIFENPTLWIDRYKTGDKKGKVRAKVKIRLAKDADTIDYKAQQKIDPNTQAVSLWIDMGKGVFKIPKEDIYLLEFLEKCKENEANGGKIFRKVDVSKEKEIELNAFEEYDKATAIIMDASDRDLRAIAMWFINPSKINDDPQDLKLELRRKCQSPTFVEQLNKFNLENSNDEKLLISIALTKNIISLVDGRRFVWADGEESIYLSAQAKDSVRDFSLFLKNDSEGREFAKIIAEKIK